MGACKSMRCLINTMAHVPLIQYIHVGFIAIVASTALQRAFNALQNHIDSNSTLGIDASAICCALGALAMIVRRGRCHKFAYAPLLLHYVVIYAALPEPASWRQNTPSDILLRFEFLRADNRIQLWAFTLNGALTLRRDFTPAMAIRRRRNNVLFSHPSSPSPSHFESADLGEPCLASLSASIDGLHTPNSVQLLLNGAGDKCHYFLQIQSDQLAAFQPVSNAAIITGTHLLLGLRNVAALATFVCVCVLIRFVWRALCYRRDTRSAECQVDVVCVHRKPINDVNGRSSSDARRLEDKLRQCTSLFSIETALADSGASSTVLSTSSSSFSSSSARSGATTATAHSNSHPAYRLPPPHCHFTDII